MPWPELLLIDKPEGISSFDVIRRLRKQYTTEYGEKAPKLGHAGTLDPAASGLMLIGVGAGTKQLADYIKLDKEYIAEIIIGRSTTTGDREGETLEETSVSGLTEQQIAAAVAALAGTHRLPVSAFSAIKKGGVPMYKRARAAAKIGDVITDVPYRDMTVHETELLDCVSSTVNSTTKCVVTVRFAVASGTYIRSLGEELGRRLGYPASLQSLRRTKVGDFTIESARSI